jgi:hypothetical protein
LLDVSSGVISEFILSPEEDDPFKDFSDAVKIRTTVKKMMEDGLDITHSTIFSNGAYNDKQGVQGPEHMLPNWMHGGAMVDPEAYSELFDIYAPAMTRIMAVRMLEGAFMARGGFVIFIEGHQDECPGWNGCSHSSIDLTCYGEDRFCHPEGIFIPLRVDEEGNVARLDGIDKVGDWDQFGFEKNSLLNSVAWSYLEQGLDSVATASDFTAMIKTFKDTKELENQRGAFTLPVCKISRDHPWQPDLMSETNHPPCDCLGLPDKNGKSFKDYVHPNVRKWLEQSCV